jgi:tetratricopeptide (TPR) repeat protein
MPLARRTGRLSQLDGELDRALALAGGDPRRIVALSLLKAELDHDEGRFRQAEQILRTALENSSSASETQKAVLLVQLGHLLMRQERWAEGRKLFERILPTLEGTELRSLAATCRFHLGNIALAESRLDDAFAEHQKALEIRRHSRSPNALSASLAALGAVSLDQGRYPEALAYYQEAEEMAHRTGDDSELAFALRGVGRALARLGDFTSAAVPLRRALELRERAEDVVGRAMARLEVAENYLHLNNPGEALVEARKALFQLSLLGGGAAVGNAESLLGRIQLHRRRLEEARRHLEAALEQHEAAQDPVEAAFDRAAWIRLELIRAEPAEVRRSRLTPLLGQLGEFLETHPYPELGERLDLEMFRALDTLETPVEGTRHPLFYLRRAYETLMRKTGHLPRELRSRFLLQIPDHQAIQTAAHHHGLEIGSLPGDRGAHPGGRVPPRSGGH